VKTDELYVTALEIRILSAIVAKKATHALRQRLGDAGISGLQCGIMRALHHQEQTISELSHKLMLDPSTLVPAVDALERKGLAKRGTDPQDRRRVPLALTERGAGFVVCTPIADEDDPLVKSLSAMGDGRTHQLLALLREMVEHMPQGEETLSRVSFMVRLHTIQEPAPTGD
jgi:DNA-binding MarR family transcriptional regulator